MVIDNKFFFNSSSARFVAIEKLSVATSFYKQFSVSPPIHSAHFYQFSPRFIARPSPRPLTFRLMWTRGRWHFHWLCRQTWLLPLKPAQHRFHSCCGRPPWPPERGCGSLA